MVILPVATCKPRWVESASLHRRISSPGEDVDAEHVGDDGDGAEDGHADALHPEGARVDGVEVVEVKVAAVQRRGTDVRGGRRRQKRLVGLLVRDSAH